MAQGATRQKRSPATNGKVGTLEQWADAGVHTITCPSGFVCKVRLPDLEAFIAGDALPEHLREVAWKQISDGLGEVLREKEGGETPEAPVIDQEVAKKALEVRDWVIVETVVEPKLNVETLPLMPSEDKALIASLAQRERDTDARGVTLGVAPLSRFDTFRRSHRCPESCEACEEIREIFSTYSAGEL